MFAAHPGTSPASFTGDVSFLQRAQRGEVSLHAPSSMTTTTTNHNIPGDPSLPPFVTVNDSEEADDRGRRNRRNSSGRGSRSSVHSVNRLSPTRESSNGEEEEEDGDESAREPVFEEDDERRPQLGERNFDLSKSIGIVPAPHAPVPISTTNSNERTPLLSGSTNVAVPLPKEGAEAREMFWHEIKILLGYAAPIALTHFGEFSLSAITVVVLGHLGTVELASASISSMTANVVALSVIQGFCTALDTLCPQAYTSKPRDTSLYALRTWFILMVLLIPQVIIFWNAEPILLLLKQDPRVAERGGVYLKALSFGLPGYAGFECVRRWLQAQGLMIASVVVLSVAAPLNVLLNYLLVWGPEPIRLGFVGAPIATAISMNVMFIVSLAYAFFKAPRDAWGGFTKEMFTDLGLNIKLGLAGSAAVVSEWWSWEIVGLASSFLGPTSLAAQSVLLTSASLFYQIPYALSVAAAVRAGNLLGAQRPDTARITSYATITLAVALAGLNSFLLVIFRRSWGSLFSSEPEVIAVVASVLGLVAAFQLCDGVSGAMSGLLRGAGKAPLGAVLNLVSYYVVGLPLGLCLTFLGPQMGLKGLWVGLTVALTGTGFLTTYVILKLDWRKESENARIRMGVAKRDREEGEEGLY